MKIWGAIFLPCCLILLCACAPNAISPATVLERFAQAARQGDIATARACVAQSKQNAGEDYSWRSALTSIASLLPWKIENEESVENGLLLDVIDQSGSSFQLHLIRTEAGWLINTINDLDLLTWMTLHLTDNGPRSILDTVQPFAESKDP